MLSFKIQINHNDLLSISDLSYSLYEEIGEEYNFEEEDIQGFINLENSILIPNHTFVSNFKVELPLLDFRDVKPQDMFLSFLKTIESKANIISITKTYDSVLYEQAFEFYKEIIDVEMEMRNVLTYILAYDDKPIEKQLFQDFNILKSEPVDFDSVKEKYENGLFYIYFNHYAQFSEPQKLKADQIVELLQNPTITSFEEFKTKIQNRKINETRHTDFLLSIKTKLKPLENMRNAIMHIRNLSNSVIENYKKSVDDNGLDKGVKTLIHDFWNNESKLHNESTWLELSKLQITKLIEIQATNEGGKFYKMNDDYYDYEFIEGYFDIEEFRSDLVGYLQDRILLPGFDTRTEEFEIKINELINQLLL